MNKIKQTIGILMITFLCVFIIPTNKCFCQYSIKYCGSFGHPLILSISDTINVIQTDENVLIDLYRDFAAIKGQFVFYNSGNKPITIRIGYRSNELTSGFLNYDTKEYSIFSDAKSLEIVKFQLNNKEHTLKKVEYSKNSKFKWNKWECDWYGEGNRFKGYEFKMNALSTDTMLIYAVVNIEHAQIYKGSNYHRIFINTLVYNLGKSSFFKKSIKKFKLTIKLKDGIQIDDIYAIFPENKLNTNFSKNELIFEGNNVDNRFLDIIIAHDNKPFWLFDYPFFFNYSKQRKRELALEMETNCNIKKEYIGLQLKKISDFEFIKKTQRTDDDFEIGFLIVLGFALFSQVVKYGLPIAIILVIVFLVKRIIKMIKKRELP